MTRLVGRFRCTDNGRTLRRRDSSEEQFMSEVHEGETPEGEPSEIERQHAGELSPAARFKRASAELHGTQADESEDPDEPLTPIERFKRASDRRHGIAGYSGGRK